MQNENAAPEANTPPFAVAPVDQQTLATLPPAKRAAVALNSESAEKHLRELVEKTAAITVVVDSLGRTEAHRAGMSLKNARTAITATGKAAREDATAFQKAVIAEEKRLLEITADEEARLFGLRDAYDEKVAAEKAEKERIERERVAAIRAKIDAILALPADHAGQGSEALFAVLSDLAKRATGADEFAEFAGQAALAIDTAGAALTTMREKALEREKAERDAAEARRLESERLAAERAELARQAAEQKRIADEQAAAARQLAEERARIEAEQRRQSEELQRQRDEEAARARAEQDKREREAAEARARLEAEAAELAAARAAFERQQQEARDAERKASEPVPTEVVPAANEIWLPEMQEMAEFADDVLPDDEEIISALCERFDLVPPQVVDLLGKFDIEAARLRHPMPQ